MSSQTLNYDSKLSYNRAAEHFPGKPRALGSAPSSTKETHKSINSSVYSYSLATLPWVLGGLNKNDPRRLDRFGCLVTREWNCLRRIRCGPVGGSMILGWALRCQKPICQVPSLSLCYSITEEHSSTTLALCLSALHQDNHGLTPKTINNSPVHSPWYPQHVPIPP